MKAVSDWDEDDLLNLPVGEFDFLEVKGRIPFDLGLQQSDENKLRAELGKQVSAFANSGGGKLVLGLKNPVAGESKWTIDDGGIAITFQKRNIREWLEDIIPESVEHPLRTFNCYAIQASGAESQISAGRAIFVIEIGDSLDAPHMCRSDHRYYSRVAGKSRPIGHRMVMDIANRRVHPRFEMEFWIERWREDKNLGLFGGKPDYVWRSRLVARCVNVGPVVAHHTVLRLQYRAELEWDEYREPGTKDQDLFVSLNRNTTRDLLRVDGLRREHGPSYFVPILPRLSHQWNALNLDDTIVCDRQEGDVIEWELFADNASPIGGQICLRDLEIEKVDMVTD